MGINDNENGSSRVNTQYMDVVLICRDAVIIRGNVSLTTEIIR